MIETRKHFHDELDELCREVVSLGELAQDAVDKGATALIEGDLEAAEAVIEADLVIDHLMSSIEARAFDLVARQQPTAIDLRVLITIMREVREIERAGDNVVNIVKATRRLHPYRVEPDVADLLSRMREQAIRQLQLAVESFVERDLGKAAALPDMDDVMDDLQKDLFRWLFDQMHGEDVIPHAVQLALVGRYFERIADHAVNLAERVPFMVTGVVPHDR